jgi:hypothetical protein
MRLTIDLESAVLEFTDPRTDAAYPWLDAVGEVRIAARAGSPSGFGVGEAPNGSVTLNNARKQAERLLSAPLRRRATIYDNAGKLYFEGTITEAIAGRSLVLKIEA